jgi:outer membrane receptor for ferrienterochelin and colicins
MPTMRTFTALPLPFPMLLLASVVHAQTTTPPADPPVTTPTTTLERVEIRRTAPSDTVQRQQSTAAKTVVGREEIERMGDATVSEVLKRLPGVTLGGGRPGRGGDVRMRGLGSGYTQILLNGERMPYGMTLDSLTPDQVERIEITRGPTAETGAQAIAGTINIVLRESVRQRLNNVHLRLAHDDGFWKPDLSWTRADQIDDFSYNLSTNLHLGRELDHTEVRTVETRLADGATTLAELRTTDDSSQRRSLHAGGRMQWRLGAGETFALMPFVILSESNSQSAQTLQSLTPNAVPDYASADRTGTGRFALGRLNAQWQTRLDSGLRVELKAGGSLSRSAGDSVRNEHDGSGAVLRRIGDDRTGQDRGLSAGGKLSRAAGEGAHLLSLGWEAEHNQRDEIRTTLETSATGTRSLNGEVGDNLQARTLRRALWAQDEWTVTPQWSLQGGLRWEAIDTTSDAADGQVSSRSGVVTPLFHAAWKPVEGGKDQVRLSLTRSYRAPTLANLIARRSEATGTNLETNPDRAGNPQLKPELATGLDLAFEHYLAAGGVLSIGVFERRIDQLIRAQTTLETVGGVSRWVSRPQNIGDAVTRGVELEAKFRLSELMAENAPPVELRANASAFRSRVTSVSGPDNRLDKQPDWSANLGGDWRLRGLPLTLGASLNFTPDYAIRLSDSQINTVDTRRVIDAYALWTFSPEVQLRASVSNLLPLDNVNSSTFTTATARQVATTSNPGSMAWALRLEMKL